MAFRLPIGYRDARGQLLRDGELRLPRQRDKVVVHGLAEDVENPAYLETLLLTRMIVRVGDLVLADMAPGDAISLVESLALKDVDYLNRLWEHLDRAAEHPDEVDCPACGHRFRAFGVVNPEAHAAKPDDEMQGGKQ